MTKVELGPGGYERIVDNIQAIENAIVKGMFNPRTERWQLRAAREGLLQLRRALDEALILRQETEGPSDPGAA
jgi:hypothetical protein